MSQLIKFSLLALLIAFCACTEQQKPSGKLKIVTTTGMIADAVKNLVGTQAEITALMGPGVDPHLYKAAQGDLKLLQEADIIIYNGLHLEGKMTDIFEKLARIKSVYAMAADLPKDRLRHESQQDAVDPHIWFDVDLWSLGVKNLNEWLKNSQPKLKISNTGNGYFQQLDSLHQATLEAISTIPQEQRLLITAHDAFGYFGDAYTIEVKGIQGISTVAQAGLRDVNQLINLIIERKIKAIFVESSVPKKQVDVIVESCREQGHHLIIGGTLYSDAMGAPNTPEGNYVGMVSHNVSVIVNSLK